MRLLGTVPARTMKSSAVHFQPGDVLYGRLRPYLNKVYRPDFEGLCSAEFIVLPSSDQVDARYLQYFLNSARFVGFASHLNTGDRPRIDFEQLQTYPVPIPEASEQRRIVSAIDEQLSKLETAVTSLASAARRLSQMRRATVDALVGGSRERVTDGWSLHPLSHLLIGIEAGKSFKCEERPAGSEEWGVIKVSAMTWGQFDEGENKTVTAPEQINLKYEIRPGDVLLSRANTVEYVGAAVYVERCRSHLLLSDKSLRLRPAANVDPRWLRLVLASTYVRNQIMAVATGTSDSMRNISQAKLGQLRIPTPPGETQAEIAKIWSRLSAELDAVSRTIGANLARSRQLRGAILGAAFTGSLPIQEHAGQAALMLQPDGALAGARR